MLPLHVIHVPSATHRWVRWPKLVAAGLAIEEPAVTPADFDTAEMARRGALSPLAAWRVLKHPVPVDLAVMTRRAEVACLLSHLRLLHKQIAAGDAVWATAEDDVAPTEAMVRGLPLLVDTVTRLDPDWDFVALASWDSRPHRDQPASATVSVPGVGRVAVSRARFIAGAGAQLISLRGAVKLARLLEHTDCEVDRAIGLAAHCGLLRVYMAQRRGLIQDLGLTLFGREMFMPLGTESIVGGIDHGLMVAGMDRPDGLDVVYEPMRFVPTWLICLYAGTFLAAVALAVAVVLVAVTGRRRPR